MTLLATDTPLQRQAKALLELRRRRQDVAVRYVDPDPVRWITQNFYIPETNGPMPLFDFHRAALAEALRRDGRGDFVYSTIVWAAIKKSTKSTVAAAMALWFAWQKPWSSVKVIANDLKQANSRVFFYIKRCLAINRAMGELVRDRNYRLELPNRSTIEAVPIDPKGEAGGNDDLVVYSEIWGWNSDKAKQMWTETTLSPLKYGQSLRWCETYAGSVGESPILEELYDRGVKNGECIDAGHEFYRRGRLFVAWNTRPTCPWQTKEYYAQEANDLLETEFNRVHRNQWGESSSAFVPMEWWDGCRSESLPPYEKLEPWILALDAAVEGDCFGMVAVTRRNGVVVPRYVHKWEPPKGGQIEYFAPKGTPDAEDRTPAGELRRLTRAHSIVKVVYDPYQLHSFCHSMAEELMVFFEEFPQQSKRLLADKALRDDVRDRHVAHGGDPALREHVQNANAKTEGDKLRIVKRKETLKIDLAVCLSMANYEAVRMNLG